MTYPTLQNFNQSVEKILNEDGPNEHEIIKASMQNVRRALEKCKILYLGNGSLTFEIKKRERPTPDVIYVKKFTCESRYIGSGITGAELLANQIERYLNMRSTIYAEEIHNVFGFLINAIAKTEMFDELE